MVYLDNASTSWPKPPGVIEAIRRCLAEGVGNPGRGSHRLAAEAAEMLDSLRRGLAEFIGATDPRRVIFALNATDALNMAIFGLLEEGDHVVMTALEHNSVRRPVQALADAGRISVTEVEVDGAGYVEVEEVARALRAETRLVACVHASNVTGAVQPVGQIGAVVREHGALFLVDAAQTAGVVPIDVEGMCIDVVAFSGHKELLGPTGTGVLYAGPRVGRIRPWRHGGTGVASENPRQPEEWPTVLEAGTANVVGLAGLSAGLEFVREHGVEALGAHGRRLMQRLYAGLMEIGGVRWVGPAPGEGTVGVGSFVVEGLGSQEVAALLDQSYEIAVRGGLHCAPGAHRALGTFPEGAVRVSPGPFNTEADIDRLCEAVAEIARENVSL